MRKALIVGAVLLVGTTATILLFRKARKLSLALVADDPSGE